MNAEELCAEELCKPVLYDYSVAPGVVAFSTTRQGGYSKGSYGEFNINPYCGDHAEAIDKNRQALAMELKDKLSNVAAQKSQFKAQSSQFKAQNSQFSVASQNFKLQTSDFIASSQKSKVQSSKPKVQSSKFTVHSSQFTVNRILLPHQVHGVDISVVTPDWLTLPKERQAELMDGVDGLMTQTPEVCIGVSTADCIPVLLYDPCHHVVAAVHAGWRGTVQRIVQVAVRKMTEVYGSCPGDMKAVIGPGISLKNFEVGQEVYHKFAAARFDMEPIARRYPSVSEGNEDGWKWHIDLPRCNAFQLTDMGLSAPNIMMSGICTYDHVDDFFSARRLGIKSGRIYTGIMMTTD